MHFLRNWLQRSNREKSLRRLENDFADRISPGPLDIRQVLPTRHVFVSGKKGNQTCYFCYWWYFKVIGPNLPQNGHKLTTAHGTDLALHWTNTFVGFGLTKRMIPIIVTLLFQISGDEGLMFLKCSVLQVNAVTSWVSTTAFGHQHI